MTKSRKECLAPMSGVNIDGLFIVMEGLDGSGTTTQGDLLWRRLGAESLRTREPTDGKVGAKIRKILRGEMEPVSPDQLANLFAVMRHSHLVHAILPTLESGHHVVCDRYLCSSLAYQALNGGAAHERILETYNRGRTRTPDLTIWLDVPVECALERIAARGKPVELFETKNTLHRVRDRYLELYVNPPSEVGRIVQIDGSGPEGEVHKRIWDVVSSRLSELQLAPG